MLYRVLIGVGLFALGYYLGRQVGRVEGQMGGDFESLEGEPEGAAGSADRNES